MFKTSGNIACPLKGQIPYLQYNPFSWLVILLVVLNHKRREIHGLYGAILQNQMFKTSGNIACLLKGQIPHLQYNPFSWLAILLVVLNHKRMGRFTQIVQDSVAAYHQHDVVFALQYMRQPSGAFSAQMLARHNQTAIETDPLVAVTD